MMNPSALDQLVFQAAPLGEPLPKWPPNLSITLPPTIPSTTPATTAKAYSQAEPFFARRSPIASSDVNWPAYCGLLRDTGIPLQSSFSEMQSLSDSNVPLRMTRRTYDEGFELVELSSADSVLIDCVSNHNGSVCSRLPLETAGWHELKQMIESLRQVVGPSTPIGLGMLAGDIYTDVSNALAARVDFVLLEFADLANANSGAPSTAGLDQLAWSVVAARQTCAQSGAPTFPVFIDAPLTHMESMIKLLGLGATALCIDALTTSAMPAAAPTSVPVPKGLLSGIGSLPVKATANVRPIAVKLEELLARLRTRLFQQQLSSVHLLHRDHLRALTESAARLCAVRMLEHL